jgi:hypothetical protein
MGTQNLIDLPESVVPKPQAKRSILELAELLLKVHPSMLPVSSSHEAITKVLEGECSTLPDIYSYSLAPL